MNIKFVLGLFIVILFIIFRKDNEFFDNDYLKPSAIIYINLDNRTDRKKDVINNLNKLNYHSMPIYRLSATYNKFNGHIGCADSHIRAIKMAKDMNLDNVLILEDDFQLDISPKKFKNKINNFLRKYRNKWDAIALYGHWKNGLIEDSDGIFKYDKYNGYSTVTVGYMINSSVYNDFINVFSTAKEMMEYEMKDFPKNKKKFVTSHAIDQKWSVLQRNKRFFIFKPHIIKPSDSNSTIMQIVEGFKNIFNFNYIKEDFSKYTKKPAPKVTFPFLNLKDEKGNNLNIIAITAPFRGNDIKNKMIEYKRNGYPLLGITSYINFPGKIYNPYEDPYYEEHPEDDYINMCIGWCTCFKDLKSRKLDTVPTIDIAESDFREEHFYKASNKKFEYDYVYVCLKDNESCSEGWQSTNRNWDLMKKLLPILSGKYKLKGILVGRINCKIDDNLKKYVTLSDFVPYWDFIDIIKKSKFLVVPNITDASPRIISEALVSDIPVLLNKNIYGGWKYINEKTGEFFSDENDFESNLKKILSFSYSPRKWYFDNYGYIKAGKKLKYFIKGIFNDLNDCEYVKIR